MSFVNEADIFLENRKNTWSEEKNMAKIRSALAWTQPITILEELQKFIQPPTPEEFEQLEQNIIKDGGIRDALILWERNPDEFVLVDGHNRYKIAQKHDLKFRAVVKEFESLDAVKLYMAELQLGRRNLNPMQVKKYRGEQYNLLKKSKGGNVQERDNVAETLAEKHKVSSSTIKRDGKFAESLQNMDDSERKAIMENRRKERQKINPEATRKLAEGRGGSYHVVRTDQAKPKTDLVLRDELTKVQNELLELEEAKELQVSLLNDENNKLRERLDKAKKDYDGLFADFEMLKADNARFVQEKKARDSEGGIYFVIGTGYNQAKNKFEEGFIEFLKSLERRILLPETVLDMANTKLEELTEKYKPKRPFKIEKYKGDGCIFINNQTLDNFNSATHFSITILRERKGGSDG